MIFFNKRKAARRHQQEQLRLAEEIQSQQRVLEVIRNRLSEHTDEDLIESEIFELRAAEVKYAYLLKQYKAPQVSDNCESKQLTHVP